jgi:hypothetical protein
MNKTARFTGGESNLMVILHKGKRGHNLKVTVRTPGEKTTTGMRSSHTDEAEAEARFKTLCAEAEKEGWALKAGRSTFHEMPAPPTAKPASAKKPARK